MKCPDCGGDLRVQKTQPLSDTETQQERKCVNCGARFYSHIRLGERIGGKRKNILEMLAAHQVKPGKAMYLSMHYPVETLQSYCDHLPGIIAAYGSDVHDPAAFLVWCIENQYPLSTNGNGYHNGNGHHLEPANLEPGKVEPLLVIEPLPEEVLWQWALDQLQLQMTRATFNTWVKPARLVSCHEGLAVIAVPSKYAQEWLENRLYQTILRVLAGKGVSEIKFVVEDAA